LPIFGKDIPLVCLPLWQHQKAENTRQNIKVTKSKARLNPYERPEQDWWNVEAKLKKGYNA